MPYPNEHSARLQQPSRFNPETFRRVDDGTIYGKIKVPSTAAVIWGKLKGRDKPADQPIPQAIRFPTKNWTAEEARKWLRANNIKYISFTPAKKEEKKDSTESASIAANIQNVLIELKSQHWAMEAQTLQNLFEYLASQQTCAPSHVAIESKPPILRIDGSTAVIPIRGILMKQIPAAFAWYGIEGTAYTTIQFQIQQALSDESIKSIRLDVNSPGGTVPGVDETAEMIRMARKQKPVTAVIEDLGASAAYWLASAADQIIAERTAEVGAIGVFSVYWDSTAFFREKGIKVIVIRSGEHKGMGVPGAEITDNQIASIQEIIDGLAEHFITAVAAGRNQKKEQIRELATGQLWLADIAVQNGLIDRIMKTTIKPVKEKKIMTEINEEQIDAHIAENERREKAVQDDKLIEKATMAGQLTERTRLTDLKAAFPDDLAFAVASFEKGLTVEKAKADYCEVLREKLKESIKSNPPKPAAGASPLPTGESEPDAIGGNFLEAAQALAEQKQISVTAAMKKLRRQNPQLHQAFLEQARQSA